MNTKVSLNVYLKLSFILFLPNMGYIYLSYRTYLIINTCISTLQNKYLRYIFNISNILNYYIYI